MGALLTFPLDLKHAGRILGGEAAELAGGERVAPLAAGGLRHPMRQAQGHGWQAVKALRGHPRCGGPRRVRAQGHLCGHLSVRGLVVLSRLMGQSEGASCLFCTWGGAGADGTPLPAALPTRLLSPPFPRSQKYPQSSPSKPRFWPRCLPGIGAPGEQEGGQDSGEPRAPRQCCPREEAL